jgi:cytochrome c5
MRFSRAFPPLILVFFALLTISNLRADPAKKRGTPTPTPASAAKPTVAPAAAPSPAPTPAPSPAPAKAAAGPAKADVEAGKVLYDKFCKKCHGAEGEGVPRMYQLVGAQIVHLGSKKAQSKNDAEIKKVMLEGLGKMEVVEDLTPQQADKILAFERTLSEAKH